MITTLETQGMENYWWEYWLYLRWPEYYTTFEFTLHFLWIIFVDPMICWLMLGGLFCVKSEKKVNYKIMLIPWVVCYLLFQWDITYDLELEPFLNSERSISLFLPAGDTVILGLLILILWLFSYKLATVKWK